MPLRLAAILSSRMRRLSFFVYNPAKASTAAITIDTDAWRECLGQEEADIFLRDIRAIPELQHKQRGNIFSIVDPGHQSGPTQQKLRDLIKHFGFRIPELVAS